MSHIPENEANYLEIERRIEFITKYGDYKSPNGRTEKQQVWIFLTAEKARELTIVSTKTQTKTTTATLTHHRP